MIKEEICVKEHSGCMHCHSVGLPWVASGGGSRLHRWLIFPLPVTEKCREAVRGESGRGAGEALLCFWGGRGADNKQAL